MNIDIYPFRDNSLLRKLINKRRTWITLYAVLTLSFEILLYATGDYVLFYPGSGVVYAALLILPKHYLSDLVFLSGIFVVDFLIKVLFQGYQVHFAVPLSISFIFQAWLGAYLIYRFAPAYVVPKTYKGMLVFIAVGCLIPVLLTNNIPAFLYWLDGESYLQTWLLLSSHRALSVLLIAPLFLLCADHLRNNYSNVKIRYSWVAWLTICLTSLILFMSIDIDTHELINYSFLLMPAFLFCAVRYSLVFNALISLSVGLIFLQRYNIVHNIAHEVDWSEKITLFVFVFFNHTMILIISGVIFEREDALARSNKMSHIYQLFSNVNQLLIGRELSESIVFKKICGIISESVDFISLAYISVVDEVSVLKKRDPGVLTDFHTEDINDFSSGDACFLVISHAGCFLHRDSDNKHIGNNPFNNLDMDQESKCSRHFSIYKDGAHYATLSIIVTYEYFIDEDVEKLFNSMANNISYSLGVLSERNRLHVISEAFEHSKEAIVITNSHGDIVDINPSFSSLTGYSLEEVVGKNPRFLKSGVVNNDFYEDMWATIIEYGHWTGEFCNRKKNGEVYNQRGTISAIRDSGGAVKHFVGIMEDVTEHKKQEQEIIRLANYDILTGLPNRKMLNHQFEIKLNGINKSSQLAVLFIDLDEFKNINDAFGHQFGDSLLVAVTERMRSFIGVDCILSRFGGDEFILIYEVDEISANDFSRELIDVVSQPYYIGHQRVSISCSIGISFAPRDSRSLDELIGYSDVAMYKSKSIGRSAYSFYSPYMRAQIIEKVELRHEIDDALKCNQFVLFYQPKVDIKSNILVGFEALVRWQHPSKGLLAPGNFVSMAEESGQIISIDYWVLEAVVIQLSKWLRSNANVLPVSLNISLSIFREEKFTKFLKSILKENNVPAYLIDLELTERVAMLDFNYTKLTLNALKKLGVSVSIDDFGTGYSSLAYLRDFPIDTLKIDRAFIADVHLDKNKQGIVSAILAISRTMGLSVVAEGVERDEELSYLKDVDCDCYQGYLFSKPVSVAQVEQQYLNIPIMLD
ncbi:bifunctional diguanylate cyclase/phosphodiesterase [Shewanella zhangzhouensis]|uniref:bifunctional diguanylate cyclase/phosphodiesterase n=1 Tax=Shewanella zhangzhouensis TaxID=2864213 RepID=UPI001C65D204|nr:EAL domain-containing protein [Shewanella zhangzhouensis]QYK03552.1 EAL domain-containing protein [Shewanella zhangzhouensis]